MNNEPMEKDGMIRVGHTPPEDEEKCASADQLEAHVTRRLSDSAADKLADNRR